MLTRAMVMTAMVLAVATMLAMTIAVHLYADSTGNNDGDADGVVFLRCQYDAKFTLLGKSSWLEDLTMRGRSPDSGRILFIHGGQHILIHPDTKALKFMNPRNPAVTLP